MCGITGFVDFSKSMSTEVLHAAAARMAATLHHRGPDDDGIWMDSEAGIALGHRRLSIVDLSPQGHQPMLSSSGRYIIVYNGEIYNHHLIRTELERLASRNWRGHSDTEVILEAFEKWGVKDALTKFTGMFAIALWDRRERLLHLVRDRLGEKPLYYGWQGDSFLFGSELKALREHPQWKGVVNRDALASFMRFSYLPAPYSIYRDIHSLEPGCFLTLRCGEGRLPIGSSPWLSTYWSAIEVAERGLKNPFSGNDADAVGHLDLLLRSAIKQQMVADVPLGAFLSGGVDSSTIVALMQAQSERPVKTFTIGFNEAAYNEATYAKEVARHLGTEHTELYVTSADALNVISKLPTLYDEPFGDVSQIPTYLVSEMTRKHVTVSLSGDGGDELFAGYNRYFWVRNIWDKIGGMPKGVRGFSASCLKSLSADAWDTLFTNIGSLLPGTLRQRNPGSKLHKLAEVMNADDPIGMYAQLVSQWKNPASLVIGSCEPAAFTESGERPAFADYTELMMYFDQMTYLPSDILNKVDRATMGTSLESRTPFLDHHIVEFAWQIPLSMKIRNGQGKWLLRQVLYQYVPKQLIERPKAGFAVPIGSWLRGPLREWAETLLDERRIITEGFLNPLPVREKWLEHLSGRRDWQYYLWNVLMFQAWLESTR